MDSNPICHPSPANKMKCSFLEYVQILMISRAGWWTRTPSASPLQPKKMKCLFLDYVHFWWSAWLIDELLIISQAGWWTQTPSASHLQPKKWNAHFCITINFWFRPDWSMDSNPIHHPSPTNKMKCSFLDYAQLLMIGRAGWWTRTPSTTPLYPKKWNAHFWIMFNFWWLAELLDWLEPHPPHLTSQKHEMLVFV